MPFYMDLHVVPGATAEAAAKAHREDLQAQEEFGCNCVTYWVDVERGRAFCLIDAPNKEAINKLHQKTLGIKPLEIIEVNHDAVKSFLGRAQDPLVTKTFDDVIYSDLKIFDDPAFRIIMVTQITNVRLLNLSLGQKKSQQLQDIYKDAVQQSLKTNDGREIKGEHFLASFKSVFHAVDSAMAIQKALSGIAKSIDLKLCLHAGMPVTRNQALFGEVVRFGKYLCTIGQQNQIIISPIIRQLYKKEYKKIALNINAFKAINSSEESFIDLLMDALINNWHKSEFTISDFCLNMAMSKSELYRKSKSLTGMSMKTLLREYRLQKSLQFLDKKDNNIAQTAFDTGFSSPSYFAKCFHKRFGIQPTSYINS